MMQPLEKWSSGIDYFFIIPTFHYSTTSIFKESHKIFQ